MNDSNTMLVVSDRFANLYSIDGKETNQDRLQPETERKNLINRDTMSHIDVLKNSKKLS